ncbi:hypothetical protein LCGC14_1281740, partial [marine sediment metagenome]
MAEKVKFDIDVETKRAVEHIKFLDKAIAHLGGKTMLELIKQEKAAERALKALTGTTKKANVVTSRFTQSIALANLQARAYEKAIGLLSKGLGVLGKSVLVAAQIDELGTVFRFVGQNAGYSAAQLKKFNWQLRQSGIRQDVANQALLRAIQANISLEDAIKLSRVGQDAATVGLMESSQAYQIIIESIAKLFPRNLKQLGIIINLNNEYAKHAKVLKISVSELTEAQKKQAMMNAVMERGERLTGAYEIAMTKVSKRMRSIPRWFMDAQQAVGKFFTPALGEGIDIIERFLKAITNTFGTLDQQINKFDKLRTQFDATGKEAVRLGKRYDELTSEGELNTEQQEELNSIMQELGRIMPGVIEQVDDYGKVTEINTGLIEKFNKVQQAKLLIQQADLIADLGKEYQESSETLDGLVATQRRSTEAAKKAREASAAWAAQQKEVQGNYIEEQKALRANTTDKKELEKIDRRIATATDLFNKALKAEAGYFVDLSGDIAIVTQSMADQIDIASILFPQLEKDSAIGRVLIRQWGDEFVDNIIKAQKLPEAVKKALDESVINYAQSLKDLQKLQSKLGKG